MAVRTKDHFSAAGQHFTGILMDNCLMRRNVNTAIFLGTGKSEHVVIFIDGTAYCAKGIMAVGQHIWNREFFQSGCAGCLDDTYKGNIMRG